MFTIGTGSPFKIGVISPSIVLGGATPSKISYSFPDSAGIYSPNKFVSEGIYTPLGIGATTLPSNSLTLQAGFVKPVAPRVTSPYISGESLINAMQGLGITLLMPALLK